MAHSAKGSVDGLGIQVLKGAHDRRRQAVIRQRLKDYLFERLGIEETRRRLERRGQRVDRLRGDLGHREQILDHLGWNHGPAGQVGL